MNVSRSKPFAVAALLLILAVIVASCSSGAGNQMGGSAGIAQAQARATATAEVIQTATASAIDAQARIHIAETRQAEIANGVVQSTLTAQDQQINEMVIVGAKAQLTAQAVNVQETATAVAIQKTAMAEAREATRQAVVDAAIGRESSNRFWGWVGLIIVMLLIAIALLLVGGFVLLGWRFVTRNSYIPHPNGNGGVVVHYSPWDLMNRRGILPQYELLLPAAPEMPSAAPEAVETMRFTDRGKVADPIVKITAAEKSRTQIEWEKWVAERGIPFIDAAFIQARETGDLESNEIPRWDALKVYCEGMSGRWWTEVTDVLNEVRAISKAPGKKTLIALKDKPTITDLAILAGKGKLFPPYPAKVWLQSRRLPGNGTARDNLEQVEQSGEDAYVDPDWEADLNSAVRALPGVDR